jgi:hypothetical protein
LELNQGKVQIAGKKSFPREITVRSDEI